ncbi:MAG: DUF1566 domain-containing protein [Candidatus Symbiothrix sp.]|nr:DUF1566 domain-containing protein [Candidatus Symbiothrix sp.]
MKQRTKRNWVACLAAFLLVLPVTLQAQVHIGGPGDAVKGALLDLTIPTGTNLGLLPLNISIGNINQIPDAFSDKASIVNGDLQGLVVYNINTDTGGPGLFVWDGVKWNKVECPLPTVSLPTADTTLTSYGETTRRLAVTATGNGGTLSYQWQSCATFGGTYANITSATGATYDAPVTATGSLYYQCIVSECDKVTSKKFTVNVPASLSENGSYRLTGTRCYDIALSGNNLATRVNDFAVSFVKPYSFKYDNSFTNLSYTVLSDSKGIVSSISIPTATTGSGTGTIAFNVTFDSNVRTIVGEGGSATARIAAFYTDNAGADKIAYIDVKVQDNTCCDGAVIVGGAFDYAAAYKANNGSTAGDGAKAGGASGSSAVDWSPKLTIISGTATAAAWNPYFTAAGRDLCVYKFNYKKSGSTNGQAVWADAVNNCANGNFADLDAGAGWYLPNFRELLAIYLALGGVANAAVDFGQLQAPNYVPTSAEAMQADTYHSSTQSATNDARLAKLRFSDGETINNTKGVSDFVRCVKRI